MNARQSLKLVVEQNEKLSDFNLKATQDIKSYNELIIGVIKGQLSFCDYCEENRECQRECKGTGCEEWWLAYELPEKGEAADGTGTEKGECLGVLLTGQESGERAEIN